MDCIFRFAKKKDEDMTRKVHRTHIHISPAQVQIILLHTYILLVAKLYTVTYTFKKWREGTEKSIEKVYAQRVIKKRKI